jgi:6-phosphogluconolactonase (cycloisomerase 2 family)
VGGIVEPKGRAAQAKRSDSRTRIPYARLHLMNTFFLQAFRHFFVAGTLFAPCTLLAAEQAPGRELADREPPIEVQTVALPYLLAVNSVTVSADGRFLYASAFKASTVAVLKRDPETGLLEPQDEITTPDLDGAVRIRLSRDNQYAAVPAWGAGTVTLFKRDPATGRLTIMDVAPEPGTKAGDSLPIPADAQLSADNHFIYTAVLDGLAVFKIDGEKLGLVQRVAKLGLEKVRGLALHPSGRCVYIAGYANGALAVLRRDPNAGTVELLQLLKSDAEGIDSLAGAFRITCSPEGNHVYVSSGRFGGSQSVTAFAADEEGKLKLIEAYVNNADGVSGFEGGNEIVVSPDGNFVYAVASLSDRLVRFRRDRQSGKLTFLGSQDVGANEVPGAAGLCFSPDGKFVYVADEDANAIVVFKER